MERSLPWMDWFPWRHTKTTKLSWVDAHVQKTGKAKWVGTLCPALPCSSIDALCFLIPRLNPNLSLLRYNRASIEQQTNQESMQCTYLPSLSCGERMGISWPERISHKCAHLVTWTLHTGSGFLGIQGLCFENKLGMGPKVLTTSPALNCSLASDSLEL